MTVRSDLEVASEVLHHRHLSHLINGRYPEANEQLNVIASMLEVAPAAHD
jgi:hypothetical protein